jgi:multimeric flavodoxin WrbA
MTAEIFGISGSPVPNSNTDRAVQMVMEASGLRGEFVKLSTLEMEPCRACIGCVEGNECVVHDDARDLSDRFRGAAAFVLGGYTPYSSLDARTKMFMERMYCLRHQTGLNAGKVGAAVLTTAMPTGMEGLPPAAETAASQVAFWMMEEGMENLGSLIIMGNVPCIRCGHGDDCAMSGVKMLGGPEATVASMGVQDVAKQETLKEEARALGERIGEAVRKTAGQ